MLSIDDDIYVVDNCPDVDLLQREPISTIESIAPYNNKKMMKLKTKLMKKKQNVFM